MAGLGIGKQLSWLGRQPATLAALNPRLSYEPAWPCSPSTAERNQRVLGAPSVAGAFDQQELGNGASVTYKRVPRSCTPAWSVLIVALDTVKVTFSKIGQQFLTIAASCYCCRARTTSDA